MAYSTNNRPYQIVAAVAGGAGGPTISGLTAGSSDCGGSVWAYRSSDAIAAVQAANYFAEGFKLGMRRGDIVFAIQFSTAFAVSSGGVGVITAVNASSAATLGFLFSSN